MTDRIALVLKAQTIAAEEFIARWDEERSTDEESALYAGVLSLEQLRSSFHFANSTGVLCGRLFEAAIWF